MTKIAKHLKKNREKQGLTQLGLSKLLGYTCSQIISNVERGKSSVPATKLMVLSQVLDVPVDTLVKAKVEDYRNKVMSTILDA